MEVFACCAKKDPKRAVYQENIGWFDISISLDWPVLGRFMINKPFLNPAWILLGSGSSGNSKGVLPITTTFPS
jgi:hypothetical protein